MSDIGILDFLSYSFVDRNEYVVKAADAKDCSIIDFFII